MNWWRAHHGIATDAKYAVILRHIASRCVTEGHPTSRAEILAVWVWIIDFSSQSEERGVVSGIDPAQIAVTLDIPDETVISIIQGFEKLEMISSNYLKAWNKRQPKREDPNADRQRRYKDRKREKVTQGDAKVTQGDAPMTVDDAVTPSRERPRDLLSSSSITRTTSIPRELSVPEEKESGEEWFEEIYTRHPKKKDRGIASQYISQLSVDRVEFDRVHLLWCEEWAKEKSTFAPSLAQWILDQGWKYPPNGNGRKPPRQSGCPVCRVVPCNCFERELAREAANGR